MNKELDGVLDSIETLGNLDLESVPAHTIRNFISIILSKHGRELKEVNHFIKCKHCLQPKEKIRGSKIKNRQAYYYVDGNGKRWNGSKCPDCHKVDLKEGYKRKII